MTIRFWRPSDLWDEVHEEWEYHVREGSLVGGRIGKHTRKVQAFEDAVADIHGYRHAVAFGSCSTAMASYVSRICPHLRNIMSPAYTYHGIKAVAKVSGSALGFHDIHPRRWTWDGPPEEGVVGLMVPVVMFGVVPRGWEGTDALLDAAHGFGQDLLGLDAAISFSAGKPITAIEGGAILTNSDPTAEELRDVRFKFSRMDELRATYGLACIGLWNEIYRDQRERDARYRTRLKGVVIQEGTWHYLTVVRVPGPGRRDEVFQRLRSMEVETVKYYESMSEDCPESVRLGEECIALPCWYGMPCEEQDRVIDAFNTATEG